MDKLGNIFISGIYVPQNDNTKFLTLKYNSTGVFQWAKFYQGPDTIHFGYIDRSFINIADGAGNVYVGGQSTDNTNLEDIFIIKYNTEGDTIWTARYNGPGNGDDIMTGMIMDKYANIYVTGFTEPVDYVTIKYDSTGTKVWEARYNNSYNSVDYGKSICLDSSGNVYVTGYSLFPNLFYAFSTVKYDQSGNQQWAATYSTNSDAKAVSIAVDRESNVYVTGSVDSSSKGFYSKILTVKYDSFGNQVWSQGYKSRVLIADMPYKIYIDSAGNPIVSGSSVVKYNSNGAFLWADTISYGRLSFLDKDNNLYKTGGRSDTTQYRWIETTKYDENGNKLWVLIYNKTQTMYPASSDIIIDDNNNIFISGNTFGMPNQPNRDSILLLKYSQPIGITSNNSQIPDIFNLYQNYPNPFNPKTKIRFDVPKSLKVNMSTLNISVYDILGKKIATLINGELKAGRFEIEWDASNFASGIYFYCLRAQNVSITKKMMLIK
jgi:hypothetical protein